MPMQVEANPGETPDIAIADNGYFSRDDVDYVTGNHVEPLIPICVQRNNDSGQPLARSETTKCSAA